MLRMTINRSIIIATGVLASKNRITENSSDESPIQTVISELAYNKQIRDVKTLPLYKEIERNATFWNGRGVYVMNSYYVSFKNQTLSKIVSELQTEVITRLKESHNPELLQILYDAKLHDIIEDFLLEIKPENMHKLQAFFENSNNRDCEIFRSYLQIYNSKLAENDGKSHKFLVDVNKSDELWKYRVNDIWI